MNELNWIEFRYKVVVSKLLHEETMGKRTVVL